MKIIKFIKLALILILSILICTLIVETSYGAVSGVNKPKGGLFIGKVKPLQDYIFTIGINIYNGNRIHGLL